MRLESLSALDFQAGVGTKYNQGCQDVKGPVPSVFLDKNCK